MHKIETVTRQDPDIDKLAAKPIDYISEDYHGKVDIFKKFTCFKYQQEWRCAIRNYEEFKKPFILNIGSLEDISVLMPVENLVLKYKLDINNIVNIHMLINNVIS
jgi:hypothetical protein